jgi:hypothetical protein
MADGVRQGKGRVQRERTREEPQDGAVALHACVHVRPQHLDRDVITSSRAA